MARIRRTFTVLLLEDDENLGHVGDVVEVKPGYARNYLIPAGLACPATPDAMRRVKRARERAAAARADRAAHIARQAEALEGLSLTLEQRASEEGHLFGSVGEADIVAALKQEHGVELEEKQVVLEHHIKELGIFNVPIRLGADHTVEVRVWVVEPGS